MQSSAPTHMAHQKSGTYLEKSPSTASRPDRPTRS
jgi:hypothetical protein